MPSIELVPGMAISVAITPYPQLIAVLSDVERMLTHSPQLPVLLGES